MSKRNWELWDDPQLVACLDEYWRGDIFAAHREKVREALSSLVERDPLCQTVLDFGCGTGNYFPIVHALGRHYVGVDVTEAMLKKARQRFPQTVFETDDIFQSRQPDVSYDVVLSVDVLVHLPEFERPFATLYRIARRHVVLKLCYLTRRQGVLRLLGDPPSVILRNKLGFIEHFFNLGAVEEIIKAHHPASVTSIVFESKQSMSPYQAILIVSKPVLSQS